MKQEHIAHGAGYRGETMTDQLIPRRAEQAPCLRLQRKTLALLASLSLVLTALAAVASAAGTTATLDIDVDKPGVTIPPTFYGLMTEEINHSYDGGLYAELIQNRTFQDNAKQPAHWSLVQDDGGGARMEMDRAEPVNAALPISLRLDLAG